MIASMRSTQEGAAYFNGGRAEKIFQGQLDQMLSEELSDASASKISDPMYKLFQLRRQ
jgi:Rod binding domain-containing protein